jgi:hypothetical protein
LYRSRDRVCSDCSTDDAHGYQAFGLGKVNPGRGWVQVKLNVTRTCSPEIGKVVGESRGTEATYRLTGKELYVRAKVVSSKPHPNPYRKGDVEVAWAQPIVP